MELRYCEVCGDVIPSETAPSNVADKFVCSKCQGEGTPEESAGLTSSSQEQPLSLESDSLNMYSPKTISMHRQNVIDLAADSDGSDFARTASGRVFRKDPSAGSTGCAAPATEASKIVFRCLRCKSPLSIRPVKRTSRLHCPSCKEALYVTSSGQLSTEPSGSFVLRKKREAEQQGSARQLAEDVPLRESNPLASAVQPSPAVKEQAMQADPNKTFFLTEERTLSLNEISGIEGEVTEKVSARREAAAKKYSESGSEDLFDFKLDAEDQEPDGHRAGQGREPKRQEDRPNRGRRRSAGRDDRTSKKRESGSSGRSRTGRSTASQLVGAVAHGVAVAVLVSAPFVALAALHHRSAVAQANDAGAEPSSLFVEFGEIANKGIETIRGWIGM